MGNERRERGLEMMKKVYAGDVVVPPEGASPFADLMLEQVFAEVWTRPALSMRDRRLLIMGVIAGSHKISLDMARSSLGASRV